MERRVMVGWEKVDQGALSLGLKRPQAAEKAAAARCICKWLAGP
jgi:hypothetical protein